jgi:hypothetical protein
MAVYLEEQAYCDNCRRSTLVRGRGINHILHLLISLFCCGFWLWVWAFLCLFRAPDWRCSRCGDRCKVPAGVLQILGFVLLGLGVLSLAGVVLLAVYAASIAKPVQPVQQLDPPPVINPLPDVDPPDRQIPDRPKPPDQRPGDEWTPHNKPIRSGDVQVQITGVSVGKVPLKDVLREGQSKDALLMVKLELLNQSATRKLEYRGWAGRDFALGRDYATVKDNFGNGYKRISFGFSSQPVGAVERTESIYPNKSVTDVLVFEPPLDTATHLDLELPAKNFGGEGMLRFRVPKSAWATGTSDRQPGTHEKPPEQGKPDLPPSKPETPSTKPDVKPMPPVVVKPPEKDKPNEPVKPVKPPEETKPAVTVTIRPPKDGGVLLASSKLLLGQASKSTELRNKWIKDGSVVMFTVETEVELISQTGEHSEVRYMNKKWMVATEFVREKK